MIKNARNLKSDQDLVKYNILTHDKIAKTYEKMHSEIYNDVEQARLRKSLNKAASFIKTNSGQKVALDFGCGAGNLTKHLTESGFEVTAADVSQGFLDLISSKRFAKTVRTTRLNGVDLSNIPSNSVDMVCMYSVLHHIPDYLSLIKEFMRVLKPGGVLYIDHESGDDFWKLKEFRRSLQTKGITFQKIRKYLYFNNYVDYIIRKFINPKFQREGDIHVWEDDRIEWKEIILQVNKNGGSVVLEEDYLLYRGEFDLSLFKEHENDEKDMHLLVARKA